MTKAAFRQADVRRACQAIEAVGKSVAAVDFPPEGGFRLLLGDKTTLSADRGNDAADEWDRKYGVQ